MPYISAKARHSLVEGRFPTTPGELNYTFTEAILTYMAVKGQSYSTFNDILGAVEGAKAEFYRRVVVPYEEIKRKENGDVYP